MLDLPSIEYLRTCFSYDPETGILTWRQRPREHFSTYKAWRCQSGALVGKAAGSLSSGRDGSGIYVGVTLGKRKYQAHRIIWALYYGAHASGLIDHENNDGTDNRIPNLRLANNAQNATNSRPRVPGQLKGTTFHKATGRWRAQIRMNNKRVHLGLFSTQEEAHQSYRAAALKYHGEFARFE